MALEQWEINLRKQLEDILEVNTEVDSNEEKEKENILDLDEVVVESKDHLFNFSMILFFIVSLIFFLDLKYDFISTAFSDRKVFPSQSSPSQPIEPEKENKKDNKIEEIEEKLETIKDATNNNFIKIMNGNNKELLFIDEKWELK